METTLRHTAVKLSIRDVLSASYGQEGEQNLNYLETSWGEKVVRLNLIGIILSVEQIGYVTNLLVDDGTGIITIKLFEENVLNLSVGDTLLIVGKVRMFNQEKYISPEILRKVTPVWLKVRMMELKNRITSVNGYESEKSTDFGQTAGVREKEVEIEEISEFPREKVIQLIRIMDAGNGVMMEDIIEKSPLKDTEKILQKMLEQGDIFQVMPGKVKVL